jgi:CMP-N,N'-diacetyllegionaminic acid synthase
LKLSSGGIIMIGGKSILAVIPARGGSKGVPRKNIRMLGDKPLLAWTIEEAKKSAYIDRLILSSEDEEIIEVAKRYGCDVPFVRPAELAKDDTPGIDVILHAIEQVSGYDYVVVLQPTSPFRMVKDIDGCIQHCIINKANFCVSVAEAGENPYWMFSMENGQTLQPILENVDKYYQRQSLPTVYKLNGAVYVADIVHLKKHRSFFTEETIGYIMPGERSMDIDTLEDYLYAQFLVDAKN